MQKLSGYRQELFMNLPSAIITNILSRLSTKTITQCLCVCKTWLKLLSSPAFASLRSPPYLIMHNRFCNFNLIELEDEPNYHDIYYVPGTNTEHPKGFPERMAMFGSINGLICFHQVGFSSPVVYLWNPCMGEYITIESPGGIMEFPKVVTFGVYTDGIFLNDNLHWLISDPDGLELISCFDLDKEVFQPFPAPPELCQYNLASLEVYKECLSVCDNTSDFDFVIWVMKDYGFKSSWNKEFVINKNHIDRIGCYYETIHIVKVLEDGEVLLLWDDFWFRTCNAKRKTLHDVDIYKLIGKDENSPSSSEVMDYVPSLFSLKEFGLERVENTF
ncbi:hypothetical protein ACH5RR_003761 [Cinchona calisaya]|uniref:F-box domain-containing protein n=1 Tax=Cinchona calisaya TaxID=153742 RepID=A0ABD3AVN1_9GENT